MSEDDREAEVDSEEENYDKKGQLDKRAHHNALERKRRDHIKESFSDLRNSIPTIQGDKSSRAQILKKASDYISLMKRKNANHERDIEDLKRQNQHLDMQIQALERAKNSGHFISAEEALEESGLNFEMIPQSGGGNINEGLVVATSPGEESPNSPNQAISQVVQVSSSQRNVQPGQSLLISAVPMGASNGASSIDAPAKKTMRQH